MFTGILLMVLFSEGVDTRRIQIGERSIRKGDYRDNGIVDVPRGLLHGVLHENIGYMCDHKVGIRRRGVPVGKPPIR